MGFFDDIEKASRQQRKIVGELSARFGWNGTPQEDISVWAVKIKPKKKGRPKGRKNLTIREKLQRRIDV